MGNLSVSRRLWDNPGEFACSYVIKIIIDQIKPFELFGSIRAFLAFDNMSLLSLSFVCNVSFISLLDHLI